MNDGRNSDGGATLNPVVVVIVGGICWAYLNLDKAFPLIAACVLLYGAARWLINRDR